MKKAMEFVFPLLVVAAAAAAAAAVVAPLRRPRVDPGHIVVASWNVENLFDADDDPDNEGDDAYTRSGWTRWTNERYRQKLTNLTEIISEMAPDVLVLSEVENRRVLDDLREVLEDVRRYPMDYVIHRDSTDFRGIDVAMLSRIRPRRVTWLDHGRGLRYSPVAEFRVDGKDLVVVGNHWKSRFVARGSTKEHSDRTRRHMALRVRDDYLYRLRENPRAAILVTGDFNDDIGDPAPVAAGFSTDLPAVLSGGTNLFCLSALLPRDQKSRGTYYYSQSRSWNSFDSINVSRGLLDAGPGLESPWRVLTNSYGIYATPKQRFGAREPSRADAPYPCRRVGNRYGHKIYDGYSDHFPVRVVLRAR